MSNGSFFNQLKLGIQTYGDAHRFIFRHRLWTYLIIPGILHTAIIALLVWISIHYGDEITAWVAGKMGLEDNWWSNSIKFLLSIVIHIFLLILYAFVYKNLVLIILSPFLALLSEKTDELATGNRYPFRLSQLLRDVIRGIRITIRNLAVEIICVSIFWMTSFIPLVNLLGFAAMILVQSYFYGFSMMDYSSERRKMNVKESIGYISRNKGIAIGNGLVFYAFFLVPVIGWMVAPSYAVVAATLAIVKTEQNTFR